MRPTRLKLALGLLGFALVAGCTSTTAGSAEPAPTDSSSESPTAPTEQSDGPSDGAPDVADPIDVSQFQEDPCQAFTAEQLGTLAVNPDGESSAEPSGKACRWRHPDGRGSVQLTFLDQNDRGIGGVYAGEARGEWVFFEEMPPLDGGYPVVSFGKLDDRDTGRCAVAVGVSNQVAFLLHLAQSAANVGAEEPCEVASRVAGMALETMKGA